MRSYEEIIDILSSSDYYKAKELIKSLDDKDSFATLMISISNPFIYDRFTKMFDFEMYTYHFNRARNKLIKITLERQSDDRVLDYFKGASFSNLDSLLLASGELESVRNNSDFNGTIERISNRWLTEYIIYYFFQDSYYNFMVNSYQMISYLGDTKKNLVSRSHIDIYNEFRELHTMSFKEKLALFEKNKDSSFVGMFYDDMRKVKDDSYCGLVDSTIKLGHDSKIYQKELSRNCGVDIYYLNGEDFYAFVKVFPISRDDLSDHFDHLFLRDGLLGNCFSFTGHNNIGTIDREQKSVAILYDDIDYKNIMYVHHADLHVGSVINQNGYLSQKENEITTPSSLIARTKNYSDVYIVGKPKPKALVCYSTVTSNDILFAKKHGLSILLMNCDKYRRYETYEEGYDEACYVI